MKSEAQQLMSAGTSSVWTDDTTFHTKKKKLPSFWLMLLAAGLAAVGIIGGSIWLYVSGLQKLHGLTAQIADNQAAARLSDFASHWAILIGATAIGGGVLVFVVTLVAGRWLKARWLKFHLKEVEESEARSHKYLAQLADLRVSAEEAKASEADMRNRFAAVTQNNQAMERELEQRRQAEKSLAQQTHQLERSKDVLEMHVQTRTQELQKLQRRNEQILNSAADGICGFDPQGRATFVNQAAARMVGWKLDDMSGKTEEMIFFGSKTSLKVGSMLVKNEKGEFLPEQTFFRKDGSSFPAEYARTLITENNRVVGTVVTFKDITERRSAEDKLNQKAEELSRSNRELEQFAFVASHDLQEPLRKIQAFGDRLKEKCEALQLNEGKDYLERMQSAAARMQTLINDLLTFSRVLSSSQPFAPVNLTSVTQEVLVDLEHRIEKTGAQVQVGKLPTLEADATQMRQLLQNLIGNALKFQLPNAVPVVKIDAQLIQRDQIQEDVVMPKSMGKVSPEDKFCVLTVQDNGIGFDEQYLEKVFAVFQRLHGRTEYEGTGVGLAVCRRIAERHGGLITAQSKLGEGAIFIVILPMKQPAPEELK